MQSLWVYNDVAVPDSPTSRSEHDPLSLESPGSSFGTLLQMSACLICDFSTLLFEVDAKHNIR